uniref:Uncharacterized protein n=1 Tax=Fomitiporia mediterranea TaxID=208960 RepID=A0A5B9RAY8_9AGAM|nr:hypothetical protein Fomme_000096 [Fomitiporia mediterranea]QEG57106.1 hypothetical protein Fomme_000096 [Fomitiporia mediterranea]
MPVKHFKLYINKFFFDRSKDTRYMTVQVQIIYNNNKLKSYLCNKVTLDLSNSNESKTLRNLICYNFNKITYPNEKLNVNKIYIYYIETNQEKYNNFINEMISKENFNLDMLDTKIKSNNSSNAK